MDLLTKKPMLSAVIPVIDPDSYGDMYVYGEGTPIEGMTYTLAGKTSPEFKAAQREAEKQADAEGRGLDLFAGVITGFTGFNEGGTTLECNMDTKRRLLTEYDWWLEQVIVTVRTRSAFLPNARMPFASQQPSALGVRSRSGK